MKIKESAENYLEAILMIKKQKGSVRSIDIAHELNFSKPSVSRAVGLLKDQNFIIIDEKGYITLTEEGICIAKKIYERHTVLSKAMIMLGVDEATACDDACKIEHVISDKSFEAIKKHMKNK